MKFLIILFVCVLTYCSTQHKVQSAFCHGKPSPNAKQNTLPLYTKPPQFLNQTKNGKLFRLGDEDASAIKVVHVYGTPYEMGFAHGSLLKDELNVFFPTVEKHLIDQVVGKGIKYLPLWLEKIIIKGGIDAALYATYLVTKKYTGSYFYEELRGIADASGVKFETLRNVHLLGELTKGSCSMIGANGKAVPNNEMIQLRSFDWDTVGPFKDFPAIVVYHPEEGNGHAFANVGFVGWVGSFAGMSIKQMGISEIGVSYPDESFGKESRIGTPFTFLLRDVLQFDNTVDDAITRITSAKRTCDLILGVGDGKVNQFKGFQYSSSVARVIDDQNLLPANRTWHPIIDDVVYWGMDWLCPTFTSVMAEQIQKNYGNITPETIIKDIVPIVQTGDLLVSIYDLTNMNMYVSFAKPRAAKEGSYNAFDRRYTKIDMNALFAEPKPTL